MIIILRRLTIPFINRSKKLISSTRTMSKNQHKYSHIIEDIVSNNGFLPNTLRVIENGPVEKFSGMKFLFSYESFYIALRGVAGFIGSGIATFCALFYECYNDRDVLRAPIGAPIGTILLCPIYFISGFFFAFLPIPSIVYIFYASINTQDNCCD